MTIHLGFDYPLPNNPLAVRVVVIGTENINSAKQLLLYIIIMFIIIIAL